MTGVSRRVDNLFDFIDASGRLVKAGEAIYEEGSIAFHKMNDLDFIQFFELVCFRINEHFLPNVTIAELRYEIEKMTGYGYDGVIANLAKKRLKAEERGYLALRVIERDPNEFEADDDAA